MKQTECLLAILGLISTDAVEKEVTMEAVVSAFSVITFQLNKLARNALISTKTLAL